MKNEKLLNQIESLIKTTRIEREKTKNRLDESFLLGKENGLLWAKMFILKLEEMEIK